jgi:predicted DsbA family dithiol-disulfide isomerase
MKRQWHLTENRHVCLCAQQGFSPLQELVVERLCGMPLMRSALLCRLFRSQRVSNPLGAQAAGLCSLRLCSRWNLNHQRASCPLAPQAGCLCNKVSLRGAIFREIREVRIFITNYLDVMSSWCFWSQPTWAELKRRYADRVEFDWKIALMDGAGLPKSRAQEEWYYRRSGLMNRSPFMLRSDSYEPVLPEYLAPNLVAEAARDLGIKDDSVRLALSNAILREGSKAIRDVNVAAEIGARAGGLEKGNLLERVKLPEIEKRIRQSTTDWEALKVTQRPTFLVDTEIGDRAIFSGVIRLEPIAATLDSMIDDAAAYAAHAAHFGAPPAQ